MISYQREQQQTIPDSEVIIVGVGGAGSNMMDRVALEGMEDAQMLALNTDSRTLGSTVAKHKIQMGMKLTRGLGCGGSVSNKNSERNGGFCCSIWYYAI